MIHVVLFQIVEKLVGIVDFIHLEINRAFLENHAEQSSGELRVAKNLARTLGPAGLALHYANVILQLKTLVCLPFPRVGIKLYSSNCDTRLTTKIKDPYSRKFRQE